MIAIGTSEDADYSELRVIASTRNDVVRNADYDELSENLDHIVELSCKGEGILKKCE